MDIPDSKGYRTTIEDGREVTYIKFLDTRSYAFRETSLHEPFPLLIRVRLVCAVIGMKSVPPTRLK